jgi:anti-sigma B factor antagonist
MEVLVHSVDKTVVVTPVGEVDLNVARELQSHLKKAIEGKPAKLIVDLGKVPYMDSSGVATLVEAMQITRKQSTRLVLCDLRDKVRSVFEIARLDRVFTIVDTLQAAQSA